MEKLFTNKELEKIIYGNFKNPVLKFHKCSLMHNDNTPHDTLISVSSKHNLLLTMGNSDTGNKHIVERHGFWSTNNYTIKINGEKKFQNQGRFPMSVVPFNYLDIADKIYDEENKTLNTKNDNFDVYEGIIILEEREEKVRLLLYKNTKVIHTLYLVNSKFKRKKIKHFPFIRGKVKIITKNKYQKILIPYLDVNNTCKYGVLIEKNYETEVEKISINLFKEITGKWDRHFNFIEIQSQKLVHFESEESARITYQNTDLRQIERLIFRIEKFLIKHKIKLGLEFKEQLMQHKKELEKTIYNTI